jgi:hypothetical protein
MKASADLQLTLASPRCGFMQSPTSAHSLDKNEAAAGHCLDIDQIMDRPEIG